MSPFSKRRAPEYLRQLALNRDLRRCVFPRCAAVNLDIHHVQWLSKGGRHSLGNLATLCPNHHRSVHLNRYAPAYVRWWVRLNFFRHRESDSRYPRRIIDVHDRDLAPALRLYVREIPSNLRDSPQDIRRWLRECAEERVFCAELQRDFLATPQDLGGLYQPPRARPDLEQHLARLHRLVRKPSAFRRYVREDILRFEDYLWVHKVEGTVVGFAYYQYYFKYRLAFVSYLVSKDRRSTPKLLARAILRQLRRSHPECHGLVGELEDPASLSGRLRRRARARLELFCKRWGIPILLGARYIHPRLRLGSTEKEQPLILMYYPLRGSGKRTLGRGGFKRILDLIFWNQEIAFDTQPEFHKYRRYLARVKRRVLLHSRYPIRVAAWDDAPAGPGAVQTKPFTRDGGHLAFWSTLQVIRCRTTRSSGPATRVARTPAPDRSVRRLRARRGVGW